jgi:hypothetical protein
MVTEWVLFMNASLATLLIAALPGRGLGQRVVEPNLLPTLRNDERANEGRIVEWPSLLATWSVGLAAVSLLMCVYGFATLAMYQQHLEGKPWANHARFGPEAKWRIDPILKRGEHP